MRSRPRGRRRSVDRGTHRPAIEPRKWFSVPYADTVFNVEGNAVGRANASVRPVRRGLRTWHVRTLLVREPGDLGLGRGSTVGPHREGEEPKPMTNGPKKSDLAKVAVKPTNKAGHKTAAESVEPRARAEGNANRRSTDRTQSRTHVSQALERVRQAARARKKERFTALLHHISVDLLRLSFYALKRNAAPGVDGVTWQDYEAVLESNLQGLHNRVHRGAYRALPSRRKYIPKPDGRQRPLGIAALEDKILQQAVVAVLNAIYEEDFLGFSYGFRPRRSQHDALDALIVGIQ